MKKRMSGVKRRSLQQQERDFLRRSRAARFAIRQAEGGGAREKARRVKQMLAEKLKAENGVKVVYENPCGIEQVGVCDDEPAKGEFVQDIEGALLEANWYGGRRNG